jgi:hypothetical protein
LAVALVNPHRPSRAQIAQIQSWADYSLPAPDPADPQVAVMLAEYGTENPHDLIALAHRLQWI